MTKNEKKLQKEIINELKKHGWETKEYVPRKDCLNWTHPYEADLIIRHPLYQKIGWIGIEIKDHHKVADAFQQVITKYQNHYFDSINQPINLWAIIINTNAGTENYTWGRGQEQKIYLQKFGIGILNWQGWKEAIIFNHSHTAQCSININPNKNNQTNQDLLLAFVLDKCKWVNPINKENMDFVKTKKFGEVKKDEKALFEFV